MSHDETIPVAYQCDTIIFDHTGQSLPNGNDLIRDDAGEMWLVVRLEVSHGTANRWIVTITKAGASDIRFAEMRGARIFQIQDLVRR